MLLGIGISYWRVLRTGLRENASANAAVPISTQLAAGRPAVT
jgi:hypothetical protein